MGKHLTQAEFMETIRQPIKLEDLINKDNPPIVFKSHKELCDYFGLTESWLSQRLRRGKLIYRGYRIVPMEKKEDGELF